MAYAAEPVSKTVTQGVVRLALNISEDSGSKSSVPDCLGILHQGVPYEERASQPNRKAIKDRARRLIRELHRLGYTINATSSEAEGLA